MWYIILFTVSICLQHFTFYRLGSFGVTIGAVMMVPIYIYSIRGLKRIEPIIVTIVLSIVVVLFKYVYATTFGGFLEKYFSSASLFVFAVIFWMLAVNSTVSKSLISSTLISIRLSLWIISIFSALQILVFIGSGGTYLHDPLGAYSYFGTLDGSIIEAGTRAPGFFIEPSYCAFVVVSLWVSLLVSGYSNRSDIIFTLIGLVSARSASGFIVFSAIYLINFIKSGGVKNSATFFGVIFMIFIFGREILSDRYDQGFSSGTSTYYRIIGPFDFILNVIESYSFGMPFGSVGNVMLKFGVEHAGSFGATLDNGHYLLIYYFGWIGIFIILSWIYFLVYFYRINSNLFIPVLFIFFAFNFSGGVFMPEFVFMTSLPFLASSMIYHE